MGDIYAKKDAVYAASVRDCRNEGDVSCGLGENTRNSARGIQAAGIVGFVNGNETVSADVRDCVNTGRVRSESGRAAGICGFAGYCDFDGNENLGTVEGGGALLGGHRRGFRKRSRQRMYEPGRQCSPGRKSRRYRRHDVERRELPHRGVPQRRRGEGDVRTGGSILGEGRNPRPTAFEACGVGGRVGTSAQGRDAAAKASPGNFEQFVTGRNVVKNKAVVDLASCYYWDGNN